VIARGVERRVFFRDDVERERFVKPLAHLVDGEVGPCAYVLVDNHLGVAAASVPAHLRAIDAETIYQSKDISGPERGP
jgi:hypothetical protein